MRHATIAALVSAVLLGCAQKEVKPGGTYYERKIGPILQSACVGSQTGSSCHVTADEFGNALGNLDVTSYAMLAKRRDLLTDYGPYGMPALLMKIVPSYPIRVTHWDGSHDDIVTDVPHAGGSLLEEGTPAFVLLSRWIERGALANNAVAKQPKLVLEPCKEQVGHDAGFDPSVDPPTPDYAQFMDKVHGFLVKNCAAGNCHGALAGAMPLACGTTDEQKRWNYFSASDYVASNAPDSELLRRVLDPAYGGVYHEGGHFFASPSDPNYQAVLAWAEQKGGPTNVPSGAGFELFAKRVQPMLAKRGCLQLGCHSAPSFPDYKPRGGNGGSFSLATTRHNYKETLKQVALESADPNASRLIRKNLPPTAAGRGMLHRGGPLLAAGGDPTQCDPTLAESGPLDEQDPYCVIVRWIEVERAARQVAPLSGIVFVRRAPAPLPNRLQDFERYAPGSDLRIVSANLDAQGQLSTQGDDTSLLAGCGLDPATADVRRAQVSWDGARIAFAARTSASTPLRVYTVRPDGSDCEIEPTIDAPPRDTHGQLVPDNGELVHNFDPTFAPDGSIVFASTRGNVQNTGAFDYQGPQRSTADPSKLNANLYVAESGAIRQLTFLLGQELQPTFKANGQVLLTTEKRVPGFYQLAARRINLDGGDYHPLIGQRGSIGFDQVTDIVQLSDLNFAIVLSSHGAVHGAGTIGVVNRSLGPDHTSDDPGDYLQHPDAPAVTTTPFFQRSLRVLDPAATGRAATQGAYRDPSPLQNGNLLASYAANVVDLTQFSGNFDVVVLDVSTGARSPLPALSDPSQDELWPVAVQGRYSRGVFVSTPADPTGSAVVYTSDDSKPRTDRAELTFLDFPLITSLMFQNTRSGRDIPAMSSFELWESLPPVSETSLDDASPYIVSDKWGKVYSRRRLVGTVPLNSDGSTRVQIPGGLPVIIGTQARFAGESTAKLRHQLEEVQYYPGEWVTLSFRRELFDGFCGGCHGSRSGKETDVSVIPDVLTQASAATAKKQQPIDVVHAPRGPAVGPPYP